MWAANPATARVRLTLSGRKVIDTKTAGTGAGRQCTINTRSYFGFSEAGQKIAKLQNGTPELGQIANEACSGCHSRRQEMVVDKNTDHKHPLSRSITSPA